MSEGAAGTPIGVETAIDGARATVTVRGELDLLSAPTLAEHLEALSAEITEVSMDLREVSFVDSSGLNALLTARRRLEKDGGDLRVTAASDVALRLFDVAGVRELLGPA